MPRAGLKVRKRGNSGGQERKNQRIKEGGTGPIERKRGRNWTKKREKREGVCSSDLVDLSSRKRISWREGVFKGLDVRRRESQKEVGCHYTPTSRSSASLLLGGRTARMREIPEGNGQDRNGGTQWERKRSSPGTEGFPRCLARGAQSTDGGLRGGKGRCVCTKAHRFRAEKPSSIGNEKLGGKNRVLNQSVPKPRANGCRALIAWSSSQL